MFKNGMRPVHPGEVLREDYLKPLGMSANALAKALSVPAPRINDVVRERRGVSADTAMRLARCFVESDFQSDEAESAQFETVASPNGNLLSALSGPQLVSSDGLRNP